MDIFHLTSFCIHDMRKLLKEVDLFLYVYIDMNDINVYYSFFVNFSIERTQQEMIFIRRDSL